MLGMNGGLSAPMKHVEFSDLDSYTDLAFWFKNDTGINVGGWDDQSGNGRDIAQEESSLQSAVIEGGLFFEDGDYYSFAVEDKVQIGGTTSWTMFAAVNLFGYATPNTILGSADGADRWVTMKTNSVLEVNQSGTPAILTSSGQDFGQRAEKILCIQKTASGAVNIWVDGINLTGNITASGAILNTGSFAIDNIGSAVGNDMNFKGYLRELALYTSALNERQVNAINTHLVAKFI